MPNENVRIDPPLYMAHTVTRCWKCDADMPVVALIAPHVIASQFPEAEREVCILFYMEELPEVVLRFVRNHFPSFQLKYSKTTDSRYYANTCSKCGIIFGDNYLCEPDGPFFPTEETAKGLTVKAIPLGESITVRAGAFGLGGDLLLKHAKRPDAGPTASGDPGC